MERIAARMGLAEGLRRTPDRLSGGERRRAEVAAALLRRPRCLLADEPLRGVSPADAEEIADVLKGEAERGAAVLVTGHELAWLLPRADEVVWVANGTTRLFASAEEAEADWRFRRDFLGRREAGRGGEGL